MFQPAMSVGQADWSSFSALSWTLETRLMLGNCIDILYRVDTGVPMTAPEADYLATVADRLTDGGADETPSQSVETVTANVMVTNTAIDAFGPEPGVAAHALRELSESLRIAARDTTATSDKIADLTAGLIKLHSTLFDAGAKKPDEVVILDRIA